MKKSEYLKLVETLGDDAEIDEVIKNSDISKLFKAEEPKDSPKPKNSPPEYLTKNDFMKLMEEYAGGKEKEKNKEKDDSNDAEVFIV